ncbi:hypothetical protein JTE90_028002 [Oedothorax gibbosus]|uniref:C2H2-type domain-containing protein n=1 Tax=Oedothorax gibbosus TaxID=931172 RepID=A0AAV6VF68_9ARAC|nr:hypothetical protein JTE90_028002 [Oedothorax gibbosus]
MATKNLLSESPAFLKMPLEYYSCKPCDKIFNGRRPYEDHIVSANHQKKINPQQTANTVVDIPKTMPLGGYSCKACDKIFNGKKPYEDHIISEKHQKKINPQLMAHTVVDSSIRLPQQCSDPFIVPCGSIYHCNICDSPLNGFDQIGAHIVGKKHLKMKQKQPLNSGENIAILKKRSGEDADIEEALPEVKVFKVNDPIEF